MILKVCPNKKYPNLIETVKFDSVDGIETVEFLKDAIRSNKKHIHLILGNYGKRVVFGDIEDYLSYCEETECEQSNDPEVCEQARNNFYTYDCVDIKTYSWKKIVTILRTV